MKELLLNIESKQIRAAVLHHGALHDLVVERRRSRQVTGNIYRGTVTNILHNIQSAFIDISEGENGFIHISDILENTKKLEQMFDMNFEFEKEPSSEDEQDEENADIEQLLKTDQTVLVQVVKEAIGNKGARLTSKVSIAGRYLVLLPNSPHFGISRRIEQRSARERLRKTLRQISFPKKMGLICRTASQQATSEALIQEAQELLDTWQEIVAKFEAATGPQLLYEESDLVKRMLLSAVDKKYGRILVDDYPTFQRCKQLYEKYTGEHPLRLEYYRDKTPMLERFNVEKEIDRATRQKIWLPGGAYLFFDRTEAMFTIDVNSGRSRSTDKQANVEEALVQINLDAAEEIARQLRIRNIGGLIIIDFIDMRSRKNKRRVLERLRECMYDDSAKCTILPASEFGLVEMTRQRSRESLGQTLFTECPYCQGSGRIKNEDSVLIEIERALSKVTQVHQQYALKLVTHPVLNSYMDGDEKDYLTSKAEELQAALIFEADDTLHLNDYKFFSTTNNREIPV